MAAPKRFHLNDPNNFSLLVEVVVSTMENINDIDISKMASRSTFRKICCQINGMRNSANNRRAYQTLFKRNLEFKTILLDRLRILNLTKFSMETGVNEGKHFNTENTLSRRSTLIDNQLVSSPESYLTKELVNNLFDNINTDRESESTADNEQIGIVSPSNSEQLNPKDNKGIILDSENEFTPKRKTTLKPKVIVNEDSIKSNNRKIRLSERYTINYGNLEVAPQSWSIMFNNNKLDGKVYPPTITKLLTDKTGCQVNIKSTDYGKKKGQVYSINIRTYCGHTECPKKFKLSNTDVQYGNFIIYGTPGSPIHNTIVPRQIRGLDRDIMKVVCSEKSAEQIYEGLVNAESLDLLKQFKTTKIKSLTSLQKVRSEMLRTKDNHPNDLVDLIAEALSDDAKIQKLSVMPFYAATFSKIQIKMLKILHNENKNSGSDLIVYFDGTGGLARDPLNSGSFIQYFSITAPIKVDRNEPTDPFPLTDLLTASHNADTVGSWLRSYRFEVTNQLNVWPVINVLVSDFSFAQLNAALDAFNRMDMVQYLNFMYSSIGKKEMSSIIKIRLCVAHLMKNMTADVNKHFHNSQHKKLLKEVLAALHLIKEYYVAKNIWKLLCILLQNKLYNKEVCDAMANLIEIIGQYDLNQIMEFSNIEKEKINSTEIEDMDIFQPRSINTTLYSQSWFYTEFYKVYNEVQNEQETKTEAPELQMNKFFNPQFLNCILKKYMTYFPLWSCVFYEKPLSNCYVEGYFSIIKNRCNKSLDLGSLPAKPLRFINAMATRNEFLLKRKENDIPKKFKSRIITPSGSKINESTGHSTPVVMTSDIYEANLGITVQAVDDWKGRLSKLFKKKSTTTKKSSNLKLFHIKNIHLKENIVRNEIIQLLGNDGTPKSSNKLIKPRKLEYNNQQTKYMPLLKNGLLLGDIAVHTNTCAFDAFIQCILNVSAFDVVTKDINWENLLKALRTKDFNVAYTERSIILKKIYGIHKINCKSNITDVTNYFCNALDYNSVHSLTVCYGCGEKGTDAIKYMPIDMVKFEKLGITKLQNCISDDIELYCHKCEIKKRNESTITNDIVFGYVEPIINIKTVNQNYLDLSLSQSGKNVYLSEIPKEIIMFKQRYKISSIVSFIFSTEHYVSYCCQNKVWVKYDDLQELPIEIRPNSKQIVHPHLVIYEKIY